MYKERLLIYNPGGVFTLAQCLTNALLTSVITMIRLYLMHVHQQVKTLQHFYTSIFLILRHLYRTRVISMISKFDENLLLNPRQHCSFKH